MEKYSYFILSEEHVKYNVTALQNRWGVREWEDKGNRETSRSHRSASRLPLSPRPLVLVGNGGGTERSSEAPQGESPPRSPPGRDPLRRWPPQPSPQILWGGEGDFPRQVWGCWPRHYRRQELPEGRSRQGVSV